MATTEQDRARPQVTATRPRRRPSEGAPDPLSRRQMDSRGRRWALGGNRRRERAGGAESARSDWGTSVEVAFTRQAMRAGEIVTDTSVELVAIPARLVPTDAVSELPVGLRVTTDVGRGEILVEHRLTSRSGSAASIALPPGTRGVHLDRTDVVGEVGDVVDLHALVSGSIWPREWWSTRTRQR